MTANAGETTSESVGRRFKSCPSRASVAVEQLGSSTELGFFTFCRCLHFKPLSTLANARRNYIEDALVAGSSPACPATLTRSGCSSVGRAVKTFL